MTAAEQAALLPDPDEGGIDAMERWRRLRYRVHVGVQRGHGWEPIPYARFHGGSHSFMGEYSDEERQRRWGLTPMGSRDPRERRSPGRRSYT